MNDKIFKNLSSKVFNFVKVEIEDGAKRLKSLVIINVNLNYSPFMWKVTT